MRLNEPIRIQQKSLVFYSGESCPPVDQKKEAIFKLMEQQKEFWNFMKV